MSIINVIKNLKSEIYIIIFHRHGCFKVRRWKRRSNLKLHLGCGTKVKQGWINIDWNRHYADLVLDLRKPLPFANNSCSFVYSEHLLEHLDYPEPVHSFLKELFRILALEGTIRIGVPDAERAVKAYLYPEQHADYYKRAKEIWHPKWCQTRMEHLNYSLYMCGQHRFAYDEETLTKALSAAGFSEVRRCQYDPDIDSEDRQPGTLYIVAHKKAKHDVGSHVLT